MPFYQLLQMLISLELETVYQEMSMVFIQLFLVLSWKKIKIFISYTLSGRGWWWGKGPDDQIQSCQSETSFLLYDARTSCILFFIFKTCSDQSLAKFIKTENWVAAALLSSRHPKNFEKFLKLTWGCQFWVEKNDSGHKKSYF